MWIINISWNSTRLPHKFAPSRLITSPKTGFYSEWLSMGWIRQFLLASSNEAKWRPCVDIDKLFLEYTTFEVLPRVSCRTENQASVRGICGNCWPEVISTFTPSHLRSRHLSLQTLRISSVGFAGKARRSVDVIWIAFSTCSIRSADNNCDYVRYFEFETNMSDCVLEGVSELPLP